MASLLVRTLAPVNLILFFGFPYVVVLPDAYILIVSPSGPNFVPTIEVSVFSGSRINGLQITGLLLETQFGG